jgi:ubiquinone/menaquinone biosynthesis C-methylase UbiE
MSSDIVAHYQNSWSDIDVEAHWDGVANIYIEENNKVKTAHDQRFKETITHLNLKNNEKVLVISSRDCEANDYILKANQTAVVCNAEISQGLMDIAQKVRPYVKQTKIDTYSKLNFKDEGFDKIVNLETLEHVENPYLYLKELHRVLKKGGIMVISCPPATSEIPYRIFTFLFGGHGEGPHKFLSSWRVKKLLKLTNWELQLHKGTVLIPVGPIAFQNFGEKILKWFKGTWVEELGIRQFYVCKK